MFINWLKDKVPWQIVLRIIIWVIAVMVLGLTDLFNFRFEPQRFLYPSYLMEVGTVLALGIFIFSFRLIEYSRELMRESDDFAEPRTLDRTLETYPNTYKQSTVAKFIVIENVSRRVEKYKEVKQRELQKQIGKLKLDELKIYANNIDFDSKEHPRLKRIEELKEELNDKFIKENEEYLDVKFIPISISFMMSGVNTKNKSEQQDPASKTRTAIQDNLAGMTIPTVFVGFIIGSILTRQDADILETLFNIGIKTLLLLMQHWSAGNYAPTWLKKTWVHDTHMRAGLWERFLQYLVDSTKKQGGAKDGRQQNHIEHTDEPEPRADTGSPEVG